MTPTERTAALGAAPLRYEPPNAPAPRPPERDAEVLRSYVDTLRRRWRLVVALPTVMAVTAAGLSMARPRTYSAHAAFLASEPSSGSSALDITDDPARAQSGLLWIEVNPSLGGQPAAFPADRISSVQQRLSPFCPGLTER